MTKSVKQTPMMEQYMQLKAQYPDAFLFFRLGDFYELFNEDALKAAKILEITLTSRNKNAENPTPMCGVPHHSANDYIRKLVEAGHKVAICEQLDDPKLTKGMVRRDVVRVVTPGTIMEEGALTGKENHYLATFYISDDVYYLAYVDVTTGEIRLTSTTDEELFFNELRAIQARETVLTPALADRYLTKLKERVPSYYSIFEASDSSEVTTRFQLTVASAAEVKVLDYLFSYLRSVQKTENDYVQPVDRYEISDFLQMNHYTKSQLELTTSLRTNRKKGSLLWLLDQTKTAMGGRMLQRWLDKPLLSKKALEKRHQKVALLKQAFFERIELLNYLTNIYDLERLVTKISLGHANARDIDQLRYSLSQITPINQVLETLQAQKETPIFELLPQFDDLYEQIDYLLVDEPPLSITEGNIIRSGVNDTLDRYRDALTNGHQWLAELQQKEREKTGLKTLKVGYNKVFGYYIEISRLQAAQLNDSRYERKQTLANNERFITEELKELERTILSAQEKSESLEYELFTQLRQDILPFIPALQTLAHQVAALDVLANFATISEQEAYTQAIISNQAGDFELTQSRHPVVERLIGTTNFVANDLTIHPDQFMLLLTGPNMSGKSTYMRQVAYCVILNQIGCFVPAKFARLPLVDKIFTRIGSSDDISSGQSTFMVEMMETNTAIRQATPRSLLLFDELGRGTATYDGMALAEAIIDYIAHEVKATTIFSTHYHELTTLVERLPMLKNIHVGASEKDGKVVFLHKILDGPADKSYGIHVADLAGLPKSLIIQSQHVLQQLEEQAPIRQGEQAITLFDAEQLESAAQTTHYGKIIEQLRAIDLNQTTPIDALQLLMSIQSQL
ncbi:DNA mismatch repair protein MutS [Tuanshanicoccus lijuaniae]|uniref:DNA mismatch repair protein MutS n=1 Tax=Aerococcaceae bacterium zg-1292 TaxID=2774330 RepID=UPI001936AE49|nr:DNA mismatch repair protein MutS [Aerococcaceae bacterium zg-1292]QQA36291.1 DNA mismatch repair protein MutS [Aerococcaceae bacterium zg-1292]